METAKNPKFTGFEKNLIKCSRFIGLLIIGKNILSDKLIGNNFLILLNIFRENTGVIIKI